MPINVDKVKEIMFEKQITKSELAKKLNVANSRVSKLLKNDVDTCREKTIFSLANALEVDPKEIIY